MRPCPLLPLITWGPWELLCCNCLQSFTPLIKLIDRDKEHKQPQPKSSRARGLHIPLLPTNHLMDGEKECKQWEDMQVATAQELQRHLLTAVEKVQPFCPSLVWHVPTFCTWPGHCRGQNPWCYGDIWVGPCMALFLLCSSSMSTCECDIKSGLLVCTTVEPRLVDTMFGGT